MAQNIPAHCILTPKFHARTISMKCKYKPAENGLKGTRVQIYKFNWEVPPAELSGF